MLHLADGVVDSSQAGGRPARWAATGRSGGVSSAPFDTLNLADYVGDDPAAVAANRSRLALSLGLAPTDLCIMGAVHGADLGLVDAPGVVEGVDALITQAPGLALVALGADCIPMALIGSDGVTVAAVHCGWRGLAADVVGVTVAAMRELGTDVRSAILGPSACGHCYAVPAERADEILRSTSASVGSAAVATTSDGQPGIDLRLGMVARLQELGVAGDQVVFAGGCTIEDASLFSYRRDRITGRQGMAVCTVGGGWARG